VQEEADRLDGEVQRLERSIAATRDALAAVGEAGEAIADEIEQARAKQHRKKVAAIVRKCRGAGRSRRRRAR
jgi:predicted  nucleic acid-binding Zn-ribbon protein